MNEPLAGSEHFEIDDKRLKDGLKLISFLSDGIGPRQPCSDEEELACHLISGELAEMGLVPVVSEFRSCRSFGPAYLAIFGTALVASVTALYEAGYTQFIDGKFKSAIDTFLEVTRRWPDDTGEIYRNAQKQRALAKEYERKTRRRR